MAAAAVFGAASAKATVFSFDESVINKNGGEIFRNSFNDSVAPPSGPYEGIVAPGGTHSVTGSGIVSENVGANGAAVSYTPAAAS